MNGLQNPLGAGLVRSSQLLNEITGGEDRRKQEAKTFLGKAPLPTVQSVDAVKFRAQFSK